MRILFISTMAGNQWGGSEELWVKSAHYAITCRHEVIFSVYDWGKLHPKLKALKDQGARCNLRKLGLPGDSITKRITRKLIEICFSNAEIRRLRHYKPDVIFISQGTVYECILPSVLDLVNATKARLFIITQANTEYNMVPFSRYQLGKELFAIAEKLYFVSERNKLVAERQFAIKLPNSEVLSNPANLSSCEELSWPIESETIKFAMVGRLDAMVKGGGVLLQILSGNQWQSRNWTLNFYGKGKDERYLRELTKLYQLQEKVSFNGFVSDIKDIWKENHILLMPSTHEGTPLALIEAMLSARPAVVSDVGGNAEVVEDSVSGFVAEAPSVYSFGKALERMWEQKNCLSQMGKQARVQIQLKFDIDSYKKIIDSL